MFTFFDDDEGVKMGTGSFPAAQFDHVTPDGDLVFTADGMPFLVRVDDTFERAMLEAKQIRSEKRITTAVHQQRTLPISQIQSLIRAGADPEHIARQYELSEVIVRRFATSIEAEKKYAIEQFLRVRAPKESKVRTLSELIDRTLAAARVRPESVQWKATRRGLEPWRQFLRVRAPKESKVRTLSELIDRTLAAARVRPESVQWKATRRGLEPWRISATFISAGHRIHAEWSWNMHDNTVVCINNAASKLIGEMGSVTGASFDDAGTRTALDEALPSSVDLPGDSARSARIEQTMRAWNGSGNEEPSNEQETPTTNETEARTATDTARAADAYAHATMDAMPEDAGTTPAEEASQSESAPSAVEEPVQRGTDTSSQSDSPHSDDAPEPAPSQEHRPDEPSQLRKRVPISALYPKQKAPAQFTPKNTGAQRPAIKPDAVQSQPEQHGDDERKRVPISALYPKQKAPAQFTPKNTGAQRPAIKPDAVQSQPEQHGDDDTPTQQQPQVHRNTSEQHSPHRSNRASMPSWDEIMFGKDPHKHD